MPHQNFFELKKATSVFSKFKKKNLFFNFNLIQKIKNKK